MTEGNRLANAADEWRLSRNFLEASRHLAAGTMYDRATAQIYFALLHAVRALLFTQGVEPRSHRGARHLLNIHFVVPERLAHEHLALLQELQDEREAADYAIRYPNDRTRYEKLNARTEATLETIGGLLATARVSLEP